MTGPELQSNPWLVTVYARPRGVWDSNAGNQGKQLPVQGLGQLSKRLRASRGLPLDVHKAQPLKESQAVFELSEVASQGVTRVEGGLNRKDGALLPATPEKG